MGTHELGGRGLLIRVIIASASITAVAILLPEAARYDFADAVGVAATGVVAGAACGSLSPAWRTGRREMATRLAFGAAWAVTVLSAHGYLSRTSPAIWTAGVAGIAATCLPFGIAGAKMHSGRAAPSEADPIANSWFRALVAGVAALWTYVLIENRFPATAGVAAIAGACALAAIILRHRRDPRMLDGGT